MTATGIGCVVFGVMVLIGVWCITFGVATLI